MNVRDPAMTERFGRPAMRGFGRRELWRGSSVAEVPLCAACRCQDVEAAPDSASNKARRCEVDLGRRIDLCGRSVPTRGPGRGGDVRRRLYLSAGLSAADVTGERNVCWDPFEPDQLSRPTVISPIFSVCLGVLTQVAAGLFGGCVEGEPCLDSEALDFDVVRRLEGGEGCEELQFERVGAEVEHECRIRVVRGVESAPVGVDRGHGCEFAKQRAHFAVVGICEYFSLDPPEELPSDNVKVCKHARCSVGFERDASEIRLALPLAGSGQTFGELIAEQFAQDRGGGTVCVSNVVGRVHDDHGVRLVVSLEELKGVGDRLGQVAFVVVEDRFVASSSKQLIGRSERNAQGRREREDHLGARIRAPGLEVADVSGRHAGGKGQIELAEPASPSPVPQECREQSGFRRQRFVVLRGLTVHRPHDMRWALAAHLPDQFVASRRFGDAGFFRRTKCEELMVETARSLRGHKNWLIVSAVVIGGFGPFFALAAHESSDGVATWALNFLSGPGNNAENYDSGTTRFLSALTGGFLVGWALMIVGLRQWVFDLAPEGVRRALLVGACSWFIVDSSGSIASGTPWNAFFNVLVLLAIVGPLWVPAADLSGGKAPGR